MRYLAPLLVALLWAAWPPIATAQSFDYDMVYAGSFLITFGTGPNREDELFFSGGGSGAPLGDSGIDGYGRSALGLDGCSHITYDDVRLSDSNGDELFLRNEGADCLDLLAEPGVVRITGSGTTTVQGGTGDWAGAEGSGTWTVSAKVTNVGPGFAEGDFGPLRFSGTFDL